jgi:predicted metal-binding membrane protein
LLTDTRKTECVDIGKGNASYHFRLGSRLETDDARRTRAHSELLAATSLTALTALSWFWIVPTARDMCGPMTGPSAWMTRATWDVRYTALIWLMWAVMMAAMMLPSAAPMVLMRRSGVRPVKLVIDPVRFVAAYRYPI